MLGEVHFEGHEDLQCNGWMRTCVERQEKGEETWKPRAGGA
jgi:hypothetical protein